VVLVFYSQRYNFLKSPVIKERQREKVLGDLWNGGTIKVERDALYGFAESTCESESVPQKKQRKINGLGIGFWFYALYADESFSFS